MPKFKMRLRSQDDDQSREVTLSRDTEDQARNAVQMLELQYAEFKIPTEDLKTMLETHSFDKKTGKVSGPDARTRGQLATHYQKKPYLIETVESVQQARR